MMNQALEVVPNQGFNRKIYILIDNSSLHVITKDNNLKVMKLFFDAPDKKLHIREIARQTGLSSTGIIKIVGRLKREGLLVSKKTKVVEEVWPNFNARFPILKRIYNLYNIIDSGVVEYLRDFYEEPEAMVLFGSYADGTDNSKSDIDIAIITKKKSMPNLQKYEKKLNKKIALLTLTIEEASAEFKNSIANGIVLDGFLEVVK